MSCAGLGGVLSLLKERGELEEKVHWAGRANDKKKVALIGLGRSCRPESVISLGKPTA